MELLKNDTREEEINHKAGDGPVLFDLRVGEGFGTRCQLRLADDLETGAYKKGPWDAEEDLSQVGGCW